MKKIVILFLLSSLTMMAVPPRHGEGMCPSTHIPSPSDFDHHVSGRPGRMMPNARTFTPRVLVIMANFSNYSFAPTTTPALVDSMFNGQNWTQDGAKGSVRQYWHDQSNGRYNPQFDIVGPVTLSQAYSYYGGTSGTANAAAMVKDACSLVNNQVDFTQYDSNNDGKIDLVFVYYAGFGKNDPPSKSEFPSLSTSFIWPHYSTTSGASYDGKSISAYECSNELDGLMSTAAAPKLSGIGVLVHEFGHSLGLPDLYNTNGNQMSYKTLRYWSVMDYGSYADGMHTPTSLSAFERWYLGWIEPTKLEFSEGVSDTLSPLPEANEARYFSPTNTTITDGLHPETNVFYTLENRQARGWDKGLQEMRNNEYTFSYYHLIDYNPSNQGLICFKVDFSKWGGNSVNATKTAMGYDVIEASGVQFPDPYIAFGGQNYTSPIFMGSRDAYPRWNVVNGDSTWVDSISLVPSVPITAITQLPDGRVAFEVCGGDPFGPTAVEPVQLEEPTRKFLYRGQLYIRRGEHVYDIHGQLID